MDRKSESSTSQQQETAVVQGQCDQYNKWLQFVKPKLANMMVVLQEQYASDGAPIEWIEWTLEKSKAMLDNDIVLILFVEHYLKNFGTRETIRSLWTRYLTPKVSRRPGTDNCWKWPGLAKYRKTYLGTTRFRKLHKKRSICTWPCCVIHTTFVY